MSARLPPTFRAWLEAELATSELTIEPLAPEASTRRFYRVKHDSDESHIAIHSPPESEQNEQFVTLSQVFRNGQVPVPQVHAFEASLGYLLVDDFGSTELLEAYQDPVRREQSVQFALNTLVDIQKVVDSRIPDYTSQRLHDELDIFCDWCSEKLLNLDAKPLKAIKSNLVTEIDEQPKVTVHRDYHCRNLLFQPHGIGIVDFQDALVGPCMYDLASLLFDCYFEHSRVDIERWVDGYLVSVKEASLPTIGSRHAVFRALELTALQRQLKAVGIFCRLWFLQKKKSHLPFVIPVLSRASHLAGRNGYLVLAHWLEEQVKPNLVREIAELLA